MRKVTFSIGGVHPNDNKISRDCAIEVLPLPQTVYVSMAQHLGAPATPIVAVGDKVKTGTVLGNVAPIDSQTQLHFQVWKQKEPQDPQLWLRPR